MVTPKFTPGCQCTGLDFLKQKTRTSPYETAGFRSILDIVGCRIGGGVEPRTKRLLKVRIRIVAGCCEPLRTQSKSARTCHWGADNQASFLAGLVAGNGLQTRLLSGACSIPESGIEPASVGIVLSAESQPDAATKITPI